MDQTVIANFKKSYLKLMFTSFFEECKRDNSPDSVTTFWKERYDLRMAVALITRAWNGLTEGALAHG
jgi:hypothetical protein